MEKTRITLRLPPELAEQAAGVADQLGLTVNAFIVQAVRNWADYQGKRLAQSGLRASVPVRNTSRAIAPSSPVPNVPKVGPNQPCPCGSGEKYKRCHGRP
jgi:uncharacterized protein YecA (UPF0149 family)